MCGCVTNALGFCRGQRPPTLLATCRKSLTDRELEEQAHNITRGGNAAIAKTAPQSDSRGALLSRRRSGTPTVQFKVVAPLLNLAELDLPELEAALADRGHERFHARQLYRWIYKRGVTDFEKMTDLSKTLRARLATEFEVVTPKVVSDQRSVDGTRKFVLEFADQRCIEAVFIPDTPAMTFCISTQVGCAMGCGFCLTGKMGLVRNLTAGEIAGQVRVLAAATGLLDHPFNIVLMGMGEPLHNYDATMKALRMLHDENGLSVSPRRVTLSTVGIVPGLERLAHEPLMPNLAISLHATTDEQRSELVPPNRKYPLAEILETCRRFPLKRRSRITFEYVMLEGVNDTPEDARRLAKLLSGIKAKVNLIPLNPAPGIPYERPSDERVDRFAQILADRYLTVSVRKSRGQDIRAACGQLIVEGGVKKSAAQQMALLMR
ncbi:MAG: 23S rRNA (adenine(2503)-C(2))-methyltransferase RlmN [Acidobacteria bacterium]|nr:MAG: 23S rRNA (adenine(2503)-C(2))-methyltransferase RlmN [Acidobacteriota bacterium]